MAQETVTRLICDVGERHEAATTKSFTYDGQTYELEVCERHRDQIERDMTKWSKMARKAGGGRKQRASARKAGERPVGSLVREWAKFVGKDVPVRGNIPKALIAEWEAAGSPGA